MATEKYVLIDSNIYLDLCFVDIDITDSQVLEQLEKLLDQAKFFLLLPEVVKLEFEKKFNEKIEILTERIGKIKKIIEIKKDFEFKDKNNKKNKITINNIDSKKVRENLMKAINECEEKTFKEIDLVKGRISKIFKHHQTISEGLELTPKIMLDGYKFFLKGNKPYKRAQKGSIQPDTLLIASAINYLESKDYILYFSSSNITDFCKNPNVADRKKLELDESIEKYFKKIKYYYQPLEMFNDNFSAKYTESVINEFEEKRIQSTELPLNYDIADLNKGLAYAPLSLNNLILSDSLNSVTAQKISDGIIADNFITGAGSSIAGLARMYTSLQIHSCSKCHRDYETKSDPMAATYISTGYYCPYCGNFDSI